jgi:hypothetical protein
VEGLPPEIKTRAPPRIVPGCNYPDCHRHDALIPFSDVTSHLSLSESERPLKGEYSVAANGEEVKGVTGSTHAE